MERSSVIYWLWLSRLKGLGVLSLNKLLMTFDSPKRLYDMSVDEIEACNELSVKERSILSNKDLSSAEKILEDCHRLGIGILTLFDEDYPSLLKQISDPPIVIYYKGTVNNMERDFPLAVIGTRRPSIYGTKMATEFAFKLATANITIVSGLARGIDALAHKGALRAGKFTIGVIGNGLDVFYPPENAQLQKTMYQCGAVISEHPPGTQPKSSHFPARNRIICGLSLGVFIVECQTRSGTMITAGCAAEYGRSLYTIPTNLDSAYGEGNIELFRQGAKLVTNPGDIFMDNVFDNLERVEIALEKTIAHEPDYETASIMKVLSASIPMTVDEIAGLTKISSREINIKLLELEMLDKVCCIAGKKYVAN